MDQELQVVKLKLQTSQIAIFVLLVFMSCAPFRDPPISDEETFFRYFIEYNERTASGYHESSNDIMVVRAEHNDWGFKEGLALLQQDTIRDNWRRNAYVVLTEAEKHQIINQIDSTAHLKRLAKTGLIKLIPKKEIDSLDREFAKLPIDFSKTYGYYSLYSLRKPIFLRDNSLCVFYYNYRCGDLCGAMEFAIYKRDESTKWKKWIIIYMSVS
ncbi:hypothetical protein SanaruYs_11700 [Chryseotalea sanaruensis]|uniref:Uncharacterized protein n=1 Tax=Chryseotalea sanaruensis TaxID=2482724 RepID=A0A401U7T6_9BACT|nr:hypothetical protein [Chryseotalea sanaruensis]GCC50951.1 hypothetical protein SanaruYs_11700 [Chryseotalea sanaruensis]